jgi:hypothetical protein
VFQAKKIEFLLHVGHDVSHATPYRTRIDHVT